MKKEDKKTSRCKGEEGYWQRDTSSATDAARESHAVFSSAEAFTAAANGYFDDCDAREQLYGEAGLCLWLSQHNPKGRSVALSTLRKWYDGDDCEYLKDAVQQAYLRIQAQIESDPRYREKGGMSTRAIFLQKQKRFGGYRDKDELQLNTTVRVIHGENMDASDFK